MTDRLFFQDMSQHLDSNSVFLGDFNSVTSKEDHKSGNLDATSVQLNELLLSNGFEEIVGSHRGMFSYHHPSISERKSQLDHIYVNFPHSSLRLLNSCLVF